jgi:hypothetical protein
MKVTAIKTETEGGGDGKQLSMSKARWAGSIKEANELNENGGE